MVLELTNNSASCIEAFFEPKRTQVYWGIINITGSDTDSWKYVEQEEILFLFLWWKSKRNIYINWENFYFVDKSDDRHIRKGGILPGVSYTFYMHGLW